MSSWPLGARVEVASVKVEDRRLAAAMRKIGELSCHDRVVDQGIR
jgi:hypothetical protein